MKKDPVKTAQEILKAFGGKENVISATHCATRLRVEVKDASVIDVEAMKEIPGVAGYFSKSGQHQVILGTGFVNRVSETGRSDSWRCWSNRKWGEGKIIFPECNKDDF